MLKSDLERQASFERKQIKGGLEKIRSDTKKLLDKDYGLCHSFWLCKYRNSPTVFDKVYRRERKRSER